MPPPDYKNNFVWVYAQLSLFAATQQRVYDVTDSLRKRERIGCKRERKKANGSVHIQPCSFWYERKSGHLGQGTRRQAGLHTGADKVSNPRDRQR